MVARLIAFIVACLAMAGIAGTTELAPVQAQSIRLAGFNGIVYYTVEQDGYHVVATLAFGPEGLPIRFVTTLGPGQRMLISVPQSVGQPPIEVEIRRNGGGLVVGEPGAATTVDRVRRTSTGALLDR